MTTKALSISTETSFSFNLFTEVERDFEAALLNGCYQKKALLKRLLEIEIERLDEAIETPVAERVTQFIRHTQIDGGLRTRWVPHQVQLPSSLVNRIQEVCKNKGILRDAWVNRVLFLATATKLFDGLMPFLEIEQFEYFKNESDNRRDAVELKMRRLTAPLDPLSDLHDALNNSVGTDDIEEPWFLYRYKIFSDHRHPKKPFPPVADAQLNGESKALRNRWLVHKFAWCITCWAEIGDLDQLEDIDLMDL